MNLGQLIDALEALPQDAVVKDGFGKPRSYRGYYDQVAFKPIAEARIGTMLAHARSAIGPTFTGYKGGDYRYHRGTECWIAPWGRTVEEPIGKADIDRWSGVVSVAASELDKLRAEVERLRSEIESKNRLLPSLLSEGVAIERERAEKAEAEVERLRAEANARAVEELTKLQRLSELDLREAIDNRIAELSKPAAKESEPVEIGGLVIGGVRVTKDNLKSFFDTEQHGQESTATAAPSRSPQGEGVEVPPRGQEQGASGPRGIGQPAHPPGARGGESGIMAESQGHRPGGAVSDTTFKCYGVTFTPEPAAPRHAVVRAIHLLRNAMSSMTTMVETKPEESDWTVTLAAQAKNSFARTDETVEESTTRLLAMVVEGLCNLGREVRRGGKS